MKTNGIGFVIGIGLLMVSFATAQDFTPTISQDLEGEPVNGVYYSTDPVQLTRTSVLRLVDELPGVRTLTVDAGSIDFASLRVGDVVYSSQAVIMATVFGSRLEAGVAQLMTAVASVGADSVELESTLEEFVLDPTLEPFISDEVAEQIQALIGLLTADGTLSATPGPLTQGSSSGGFLLEEAFEIPPDLMIGDNILALDVEVMFDDSFVEGLYRLPSTSGVVTLSSFLTSLSGEQTAGPFDTEIQNVGIQLTEFFPLFEATPSSFFGLAVSNASGDPANLRLRAFQGDGQLSDFPVNPVLIDLEAGRQLAQLDVDLFGSDPSQPRSGWVQLESSNPAVGTFVQLGDNLLTTLDGAVAVGTGAQRIYMTRVFEGPAGFRGQAASTIMNIVNPGATSAQATLRLFGTSVATAGDNEGPVLLGEAMIEIPAKGLYQSSVSQAFDVPSVDNGFLIIDSDAPLVGSERIELVGASTSMVLNAVAATAATEAFSAQLASVAAVIFTNLNLINTSEEPRSLTVTGIGNDGEDLAAPVELTLAAGESLSADAAQLFSSSAAVGSRGAMALVGSLRVSSDGPGVIGDVIFGDPNFTYAAALSLQTVPFTEAILSHVANVTDVFFTGLALFNPGDSTATVRIEVFSPDGMLVGTTDVTLEAGRRISPLLEDLIPATRGQAGGYIRIVSDVGLIAQELFGTTNLGLLSAVPARILQSVTATR